MDELAYKGMLYDVNEAIKDRTEELKRQMESIRSTADYRWANSGFDVYSSGLILKRLKRAVDKALLLHEEILSLLDEATTIKIKLGGG